MKNSSFRPIQVLLLLAALFFLADLLVGVPDVAKKIVLPVWLVGILVLIGRLLYQETRPQQQSK